MNRLARLSLIAALMSGFLVFLLASHLERRASSPEVLIPVEGYDPRDILLGHYANIRTPLNRLDAYALAGDDGFAEGDRIWVTLTPCRSAISLSVSPFLTLGRKLRGIGTRSASSMIRTSAA